jgi:hypothetical protein
MRQKSQRLRDCAGGESKFHHLSTNYAEPSVKECNERRAKQLEFWKAQNGQQSGDPVKLARALIIIASHEPPPRRFITGADAIATAELKGVDLKAQIDANRDS